MSATEDLVSGVAGVGLPCGGLKTKNVAKKSTTKSALSRNGSLSSGAPSPLPFSNPSSRESSPNRTQPTNLTNGSTSQVKNIIPSTDRDMPKDSESCENLKNGDSSLSIGNNPENVRRDPSYTQPEDDSDSTKVKSNNLEVISESMSGGLSNGAPESVDGTTDNTSSDSVGAVNVESPKPCDKNDASDLIDVVFDEDQSLQPSSVHSQDQDNSNSDQIVNNKTVEMDQNLLTHERPETAKEEISPDAEVQHSEINQQNDAQDSGETRPNEELLEVEESTKSSKIAEADDHEEISVTKSPKLDPSSSEYLDLDCEEDDFAETDMETDSPNIGKTVEEKCERTSNSNLPDSEKSASVSDDPTPLVVDAEDEIAPVGKGAEAPVGTDSDDADLMIDLGDEEGAREEVTEDIDESILDEPDDTNMVSSHVANTRTTSANDDGNTQQQELPPASQCEDKVQCSRPASPMITDDISPTENVADGSRDVEAESETQDTVMSCESESNSSSAVQSAQTPKSDLSGAITGDKLSDISESDLTTVPSSSTKRHLSATSLDDDNTDTKRPKFEPDSIAETKKMEKSVENTDKAKLSTDCEETKKIYEPDKLISHTSSEITAKSESEIIKEKVELVDTKYEPEVVITNDQKSVSKAKPTHKDSDIVKITKGALRKLIQGQLEARPPQSQDVCDMQQRIDHLSDQLKKWRSKAKDLQSKVTELTQSRNDRRRANKIANRNAVVKSDEKVQAAQGNHTSTVRTAHRGGIPSTSTVTVQTASTSGAAGAQTFLVPVASASVNGEISIPAGGLAPASSLPPASANLQQVNKKGATVREMLDNSRGDTQTTAAKGAEAKGSGGGVKVIDLTDDDDLQSPNKATGLVMRGSNAGSANIRPTTYLLPVTSCQQILLQSIPVNQQVRTPQGTTALVYTGARPGVSNTQQIITVPSTGQQLVTLPTASSPGQLLVRQPAPVRGPSQANVRTATTGPRHRSPMVTQSKPTGKHPAPLPPQPTHKPTPGLKAVAPKPTLTISRVPQGIVLSWNMAVNDSHADISNYQLFAYQEGAAPPTPSLWKKVGEVKALPLPMACTLTQFQEGNKYHFTVRAVDAHSRLGYFSDPSSIYLRPSSTSS